MIVDLVVLALHEPYTTFDSVIIGDGRSLSISNIGSFTLSSLPTPLFFTKVLHVLAMSKNHILVTALVLITLFMYHFFTLSFRCRIFTLGSLWFAGSIEAVSIDG